MAIMSKGSSNVVVVRNCFQIVGDVLLVVLI